MKNNHKNWKLLRIAIYNWFRSKQQSRNSRMILLSQAGAFADDDSLTKLREAIYQSRERPEIDDNSNI